MCIRDRMSGPARPSGDSFLVGGHQVEQFGRCELAVIAPFADLPHDTGLRECFEPLKGLLLTRPDRAADRRGRHDGLCREKVDELGRRRTSAGTPSPLRPIPLEGGHLIGESGGVDCRDMTRVRERLDPLGDPALAEVEEAGHVGGWARRHDDRNRRHETRRDTGAPQDNVDKASTYAAVAVDEWMDGLCLLYTSDAAD